MYRFKLLRTYSFLFLGMSASLPSKLYALVPFAQIEISDDVDNSILEIGRHKNIDFYIPDLEEANRDPDVSALEGASATGIVHGGNGLKSPSGVLWFAFNLENKSHQEHLIFVDLESRDLNSVDIFRMDQTGRLVLIDGQRGLGKSERPRGVEFDLKSGAKMPVFVRLKTRSYSRLGLGIATNHSRQNYMQVWTFYFGAAVSAALAVSFLYFYSIFSSQTLAAILLTVRFFCMCAPAAVMLYVNKVSSNSAISYVSNTWEAISALIGGCIYLVFVMNCLNAPVDHGRVRKVSYLIVALILLSMLTLVIFSNFSIFDLGQCFSLGLSILAISIMLKGKTSGDKIVVIHVLSMVPILLIQCYPIMVFIGLADVELYADLVGLSYPIGGAAIAAIGLVSEFGKTKVSNALALAAENESHVLKNLLKTLAHDLATPLSNLNAAVIVVRKNLSIDASLRYEVGFIERSARQLGDIIEQVRRTEAIREGKLSLQLEPVSVVDVFNDCSSIFRRRLDEKKIRLVFDSERIAQYRVEAERTSLLHSVVNNIVSNNIKFSNPGGRIELTVDATSDGRACISFRDYGQGMPENILSEIFSDHANVSRVGTSGEVGTGFGMRIVKSYVELYGGEIEVESQTADQSPGDHGTTFRVILKMAG